MSHPRVLHVGFHPIGAPTNSGLTLGTMFGEWPEDRLLQLCMRAHPEVIDETGVLLAPPSVAPVDGFVRALLGSRMPTGALDGLNNSVGRPLHSLGLGARARFAATVVNDLAPVWVSPQILARLRDFQPEVIHTLLGGVRSMRLARTLSQKLGVPIVPHFMDDWVDNLFTDGQFWGVARACVNRQFARVLERSPLCLVIGTDMQREFQRRLDRTCVVVGNSVDLSDFAQADVDCTAAHGYLNMRYVGGLHLGRDAVLRSVAEAIQLRSQDSQPWALSLHVPPADLERARKLETEFPRVVRACGSLRPHEVPQALTDSDALVFAESSLVGISRFTRLSVSTKVPQYIASWKPTLIVGPADQGSVRALLQSGIGHYVAQDASMTDLTAALDDVEASVREGQSTPDPELRAWVSEIFGSAATRERLRAALMFAADSDRTLARS